MPVIETEEENIRRDEVGEAMMTALFGVVLALKKERCLKAYRGFRMALANVGAFADDSTTWLGTTRVDMRTHDAIRAALFDVNTNVKKSSRRRISAQRQQIANQAIYTANMWHYMQYQDYGGLKPNHVEELINDIQNIFSVTQR
jgi:hypothetical protein